MEQVTAAVLNPSGTVLLADVTAVVQLALQGGWGGYFLAPDGAVIGAAIRAGVALRLRAGDGRAADVLVTGTTSGGRAGERRVAFRVTVPVAG
jgi:hypothetical protein